MSGPPQMKSISRIAYFDCPSGASGDMILGALVDAGVPFETLERELAGLAGTEAALSYVSCWNANEALIPSLTDDRTVILSDALNHASIVDAIRLSKPARKVIYAHSSLDELRAGLDDHRGAYELTREALAVK